MSEPKVTRIELITFQHTVHGLGTDYNGFNQTYEKGAVRKAHGTIIKINLDVAGKYMAKSSQLYLNQGKWKDQRIVSASWIKEFVKKHFRKKRYGYS